MGVVSGGGGCGGTTVPSVHACRNAPMVKRIHQACDRRFIGTPFDNSYGSSLVRLSARKGSRFTAKLGSARDSTNRAIAPPGQEQSRRGWCMLPPCQHHFSFLVVGRSSQLLCFCYPLPWPRSGSSTRPRESRERRTAA